MIDSKMICFENKRNDFAQNYFADSLERFHAREKKGSSPEEERYTLTSQIRRAAVSIPALEPLAP